MSMGTKSRLKRERLRVGDIVEIHDELGFVPRTICEITNIDGEMVSGKVGELRWMMPAQNIKVLRRGLAEPSSWLSHEIRYIEGFLKRCNCDECHNLLKRKQAEFELQRTSGGETAPVIQ